VLTATLFIPDLLRPDEEDPASPAPRFEALERLLARATPAQFECESAAAWLCRRFSVDRQADWPVAPLALLGHGRDPARDYWLCAEPAHLRVHGDKLLLAPADTAALSAEESVALVQALNAHFKPDGFEFVATDARHWYLRAPSVPDLRTVAPEEAAGNDIDRLIPAGGDRLRYHGFLNEVQMVLHAHPVNQAREDKDRPALNSVWLWGGGVLPEARAAWTAVQGGSALLKGLCRLAGPAIAAPAPGALPASGDVLVELDDPDLRNPGHRRQALERIDREWMAALTRSLRQGKLHHLTIATVARRRAHEWSLPRSGLWKVWRRARPVDAMAREAFQ